MSQFRTATTIRRTQSLFLFALSLLLPASGFAQSNTSPGPIESYATIHSIGIDWDITGDDDHDAAVSVRYRVTGTNEWTQAMPLVRVDNAIRNKFSGSIMFLNPATSYELELSLNDPDGATATRVAVQATRPIPKESGSGRTLYVEPGNGGGSGTQLDPYQGLAAAEAAAQPKDIILVKAGFYPSYTFTKSGTAGNYIVWRAQSSIPTEIDSIQVSASYVWLEGFTVKDQGTAIGDGDTAQNVVVTRCRLENNTNGVSLNGNARAWYIADNVIIGTTPWQTGSFGGEGVQVGGGNGESTDDHVIAHNSISTVADAVSYVGRNCDIYGNDFFDTADDGIEFDYGFHNNRVWGNRVHNTASFFSFQPQNDGPNYIVHNQVIGARSNISKFRTTDRFVLLHNTLIGYGEVLGSNKDHLLRGIVQNNIWITLTNSRLLRFNSGPDWRTVLNYNAYDSSSSTAPFYWSGTQQTIAAWSALSGMEQNGIDITRAVCFPNLDIPGGNSPSSVPPQILSLASNCSAVDAGVVIANFNDGFIGSGPDIGAHEFGTALPHYGPRTIDAVAPMPPKDLRRR